jgi:hypothetical protein
MPFLGPAQALASAHQHGCTADQQASIAALSDFSLKIDEYFTEPRFQMQSFPKGGWGVSRAPNSPLGNAQ